MKAGDLLIPSHRMSYLPDALALVLEVDDEKDIVTVWDFNNGDPLVYEGPFAQMSDVWVVDNG